LYYFLLSYNIAVKRRIATAESVASSFNYRTMSDFKMRPIPTDHNRGWGGEVLLSDGTSIPLSEVGNLRLASKFGELEYGLRPEGYDAWVFREPGGVVTLPYSVMPHGDLYIGLISENRPNMNGRVWNAIGGFVEPEERHETANLRELEEETSIRTDSVQALDGGNFNCHRSFCVTDTTVSNGVSVYGLRIPNGALVPASLDKLEYMISHQSDIGSGKMRDLTFFYWREAVKITPCGITRAAIAQLLASVL
jgi:8-oxo-dGTP pyrophosphatase MutT (NUDIX family)